jgi:transcriptional regulator with XRE-family HTH domain
MATKTMTDVGEMLKKARAKCGYGLRETARKAGVSPATISKLEAGKIDNPTFLTMVRISLVLEIKAADWF